MLGLQFRNADAMKRPLPGPSFVLRMADEPSLLVPIADQANVVRSMDLLFNDADSDYGLVRAPTQADAKLILQFFAEAKEQQAPYFVAQCQTGIGRSQAVIAALGKKLGRDVSQIYQHGTYNRKLYGMLLAEMGIKPDPEPLVSVVVRVKYPADRLKAFFLSMDRQRYQNWEVIAVTDGPRHALYNHRDPDNWHRKDKVRIIETPVAKGRWGHPYRQLGIEAARGEYIGLSNDDGYYVPGYLEQMLFAIQHAKADMATCKIVHSYSGWDVTPEGTDLGSWIAKTELVRRHPWTGIDADYEAKYLAELMADGKCVKVPRPLYVHC